MSLKTGLGAYEAASNAPKLNSDYGKNQPSGSSRQKLQKPKAYKYAGNLDFPNTVLKSKPTRDNMDDSLTVLQTPSFLFWYKKSELLLILIVYSIYVEQLSVIP